MAPLLLDLFCGAGGAAKGYADAGFDVLGVDINPQRNYPFNFIQGDALTVARDLFGELNPAVVHASPPCQAYSVLRHTTRDHYPALVEAVRTLLSDWGGPYVIENVPGAPLLEPIVLCGSMFGLGAQCRDGWRQLRRHRLFESNRTLAAPGLCRHAGKVVGVYGGGPAPRYDTKTRGDYQGWTTERVAAMGIDWMQRDELSQAIPPAYTHHLGAQLLDSLTQRA